MNKWRSVGLVLGLVGIIDGVYLAIESINPKIPLYCPSFGIVNCGTVTSSTFSRFAGVPVAFLGLGWFVVMVAVIAVNKPTLNYALIPLWLLGLVGVGYLVFIEQFALHAICPYCTLAHIMGLLMGAPAFKLALAE